MVNTYGKRDESYQASPVDPERKPKKTIAFDIDDEMHERIKEYCKSNRIKMSQLARFVVSRPINNQFDGPLCIGIRLTEESVCISFSVMRKRSKIFELLLFTVLLVIILYR